MDSEYSQSILAKFNIYFIPLVIAINGDNITTTFNTNTSLIAGRILPIDQRLFNALYKIKPTIPSWIAEERKYNENLDKINEMIGTMGEANKYVQAFSDVLSLYKDYADSKINLIEKPYYEEIFRYNTRCYHLNLLMSRSGWFCTSAIKMNYARKFKSVISNTDLNFVIDLHNYFIFRLTENNDLISKFKFLRVDSTIPNLEKVYELFIDEYQRDVNDNPSMIISNPTSLDMPSQTKFFPNPTKNRLYQDFPVKPNVDFINQINR